MSPEEKGAGPAYTPPPHLVAAIDQHTTAANQKVDMVLDALRADMAANVGDLTPSSLLLVVESTLVSFLADGSRNELALLASRALMRLAQAQELGQ